MKPLPTLTKPLRSVDTDTHEPAQALRERTDSCTVPAAGVVGEAMVALVLADAYRQKFGGDHIDDVLRPSAPTRSGSDGAASARSAEAGARADRLHGRRQVDASPAELAGGAGRRRARQRRAAGGALRAPIAREFELHGEQAFRAAEEELVCELLASAGPGDVIALGGGSVLSERVRAALEPH